VKSPSHPQSATSLPRSPGDDAGSRVARYALTMGIRMACFVAMVLITPYGWYTWALAAGAIVLPYFAVVIANVGQDTRRPAPESPERQLEAPGAVAPAETGPPNVIRIAETPRLTDRPTAQPDERA
jgi:hypothetical protein